MFEILQDEYNWGMIDAAGLEPYIGWGQITQEQYNQIVNPTSSETSDATQPANNTTQQSQSNSTNATN